MCFCFDGEGTVAAYRPADCRERLPATSSPAALPTSPPGKLIEPDMICASGQAEDVHIRR